MGLADRFKEKLEKRDIFQKNNEGVDLPQQMIYVSKPITSEFSINTQKLHTQVAKNPFESLVEVEHSQQDFFINCSNAFEDLETETIDKIRKTPYWFEYSKKDQANMISAYFNKKIQSLKYKHIKFSSQDKDDFVKNILTLSNNK